jgi:hypothetical protein
MVGTRIPACAVEHQYFVTEKTPRIASDLRVPVAGRAVPRPVARDSDRFL